ncbi:hypothetical protein PCANC_18191 [Puccinia coronata f. sp. avenae]|uniref:Uncharacterized protein n=1 Tax=Puccinia coronata f. sp. avenae TaxID=200324 RepID=A0A2N5SJW2_9BASI|nr:hypothetical protein PCANC_18191 [Puccinia coronata f. sp. avenae]
MDMDLWWCPVCERAITEQDENVHKPSFPKRAMSSPSQPRYTSRGGVYGPKGSLYCSEACREVEELNGRFAFEQLAACLPECVDRPTFSDEPESEGTLSGTDEINTDRSRSLSLGRRSDSTTPNSRSLPSTEEIAPIGNTKVLNGLIPANAQSGATKEPGPENRRVPMLISPNGTPLIQPKFPQRPVHGLKQRRHQSHCPSQRRCSPHSTAATRTGSRLKVVTVAPKASNSVPTYPFSTSDQGAVKSTTPTTKTILNHQPVVRNDMEFGPDARQEKPTTLLRHYALFFRSRPGSTRGEEWVDSLDEPAMFVVGKAAEKAGGAAASGLSRQTSQSESQNSRRSSLQPLKPLPAPKTDGAVDEKAEHKPSKPTHRKDRKHLLGENSCRSWTWDHLPADVPQYPAMDLAQIRLSKLLRHQAATSSSLPPLHPSANNNNTNSQILTLSKPQNLAFNHHHHLSHKLHGHNLDLAAIPAAAAGGGGDHALQAFPIINQSKKKLFIFH